MINNIKFVTMIYIIKIAQNKGQVNTDFFSQEDDQYDLKIQ